MKDLSYQHSRSLLNYGVTFGSVLLCLLLLPMRLPGMELAGIGPNWLLIWVVAWSVKRNAWQGVLAGLALGLAQDGMTASFPSHIYGLGFAGYLTARLQKQRFVQEDFISVALIVFGMAVISETVMALQLCWPSLRLYGLAPLATQGHDLSTAWVSFKEVHWQPSEIWTYHQRVALGSAIVSSLWAPVLYFPLNRWWERMGLVEP